MTRDLTLEQVRALAVDNGFERFTAEHLQQLARASNTSRARLDKLGIERLTYADEPALVFRLDDGAAR